LIDAIARRYASALADIAFARNDAATAKADLGRFIDALRSSPELRNFLESPSVGRDLKQKVVEVVGERMDLDPAVQNFMFLIVDHRRTGSLRDIQQAFEDELNARMGIARAEVTSARVLTVEEKGQLTAALERRIGKKIEARFKEDEALVGGAIVRVGSTVYDGSVREQLTRLREQLEAG
jgi:F-type H+-transporting ATPase subunit delta